MESAVTAPVSGHVKRILIREGMCPRHTDVEVIE